MKTRTLLAIGALAAASCSEPEAAAPPRKSVVLICIDTLRADHLGCYGYERATTPTLDALARAGTRFGDTSAVAGWTKPSVPSFLTGTYPLQHGVYEGSARRNGGESSDVLPERATTLAEAFADAGYATAAFVKNAQLRRGLGFEQGFATYVDEAGDAAEIRAQAEQWLGERDGEAPFFLYLHFLDAHWPYPIPDAHAEQFAAGQDVDMFRGKDSRALRDAINAGDRVLTAAELAGLLALYDGAIRFVDDELGELFASLRARGQWDDLVVCVVSDHGEEFLEHGRIGHGHGLWENLLRVPWILRVPEREARSIDSPVSLVDLFPTLLAAAGVADPKTHVGIDRLAAPDRARPVFAEHKGPRHYEQAWREDEHKAIRSLTPVEPQTIDTNASTILRDGTRWEVEFEAGSLRAVELQPSDDDLDDPTELKGPIAAIDDDVLTVAGVELELAPEVEFYGDCQGDEPRAELLQVGRWIKSKSTLRDGRMTARRIKIYASVEVGTRPEIRGVAAHVERAEAGRSGRFEIGGLPLYWDDSADWDVDDDDLPRWRLERDGILDLVRALDTGAPLDVSADALQVFDLNADPTEQAPLAEPRIDASAWHAFAVYLTHSSLFSASDREELDRDTLEALRAIGYVD